MAELATIARPYAEALYRVACQRGAEWGPQVDAIAAVVAHAHVRQFADNPKVPATQVFELIASLVQQALAPEVANFLRTLIDNGRLVALPQVAEQFHRLVNAHSGISDGTVYSAFPIEAQALSELRLILEKRFGCQLDLTVHMDPALIGGVRVVVGDEVLDTSVKARLERMKVALTS